MLTRSIWCDKHKPTQHGRHNPDRISLYKTNGWYKIRRLQLSRQPWCEDCLKEERYTPATDVDHVHGWETREQFFAGPFRSLCHQCHSIKTAKENSAKGLW